MPTNAPPPTFRRPRFGLFTAIGSAVVLVFCLFDPCGLKNTVPDVGTDALLSIPEMLWRGVVYGSVSVFCWMIASVLVGGWRMIGMLAIAVASAWTLASAAADGTVPQNLFRYLATTWGLILTTTFFMYLGRMPKWKRSSAENRLAAANTAVQFSLTDLVSAITAAAVLFAIAQRYQTPTQPVNYWWVMAAIWAGMAIQQLCLSIASWATHRATQLLAVLAAVVVACLVIGGLGHAETTLGQRGGEPKPPSASVQTKSDPTGLSAETESYAAILIAAAVTVALISGCGRIDEFVAAQPPADQSVSGN